MSDNFISFLPIDPNFVPAKGAGADAAKVFRAARPFLDEIESTVEPHVVLHDCGGNFEDIRCPHCDAVVEIESWHEWMDADCTERDGFRLAHFTMPCCSGTTNLNDLTYSWPMGFSRFAVRARNAGGEVPQDLLKKLEGILACNLRVIYQHI